MGQAQRPLHASWTRFAPPVSEHGLRECRQTSCVQASITGCIFFSSSQDWRLQVFLSAQASCSPSFYLQIPAAHRAALVRCTCPSLLSFAPVHCTCPLHLSTAPVHCTCLLYCACLATALVLSTAGRQSCGLASWPFRLQHRRKSYLQIVVRRCCVVFARAFAGTVSGNLVHRQKQKNNGVPEQRRVRGRAYLAAFPFAQPPCRRRRPPRTHMHLHLHLVHLVHLHRHPAPPVHLAQPRSCRRSSRRAVVRGRVSLRAGPWTR